MLFQYRAEYRQGTRELHVMPRVMEAKARKKMRLARALNKIKNKAQVIAN